MAIVKVEPNKPLTVSLKYRNTYEKKVNGITEFKYTLQDGSVLLVPPIAHAEIQALHAGPGEPFTLTKSIGPGNQTVWKVERIVQPDGPPPPRFDRPAATSEIHTNSIAPKSTTNGRVAVMPAPEVLQTRQSKAMTRQLIAAIDAGIAATAYAKSQNFHLELTSRDICAIAITSGIQGFKEGVY